MPLWPYFWNLNGEGNAAPVLRSVGKLRSRQRLAGVLREPGLGSNVSTCDGPPFRKMWMTCFALAAKCGCLDDSGET